MNELKIPETANSIQKGIPLKLVLDKPAVCQLAANMEIVHPDFEEDQFIEESLAGLEGLSLKERGIMMARLLRKHLPQNYAESINIILRSLTPPLKETTNLGLSGLFYLPHVSFVHLFGLVQHPRNI